jgi:Zn finger protein HypA/HybF involved in hydrogenase expression
LAIVGTEKAKAIKILRIYVVVGGVSGVAEESVNFYFDVLSKDTIVAVNVIPFFILKNQIYADLTVKNSK